MHLLKTALVKVVSRLFLITVGYMALGIVTSCEIEDDYSKPDLSENFGKRIANLSDYPIKLLWSEQNEIIVVSPEIISAYGVEKNTIRYSTPVPSDNQYFSAWLVGDMIYVLTYSGQLSSIDLATLKLTQPIADSVVTNYYSPAFSSSQIAYAKYTESEPYLPSMFLYDLTSDKEVFVTLGFPRLFSPDGNQLLFENGGFYVYNLSTKEITPFVNSLSYDAALRWTSKGIISYTPGPNYITVVGRNETTGEKLGEWNSSYGFFTDMVSTTGNSIITVNDICGYRYVTGPCPGYSKVAYAIVNVLDNTEQTLVYGIYAHHDIRAFSPDEKNFAYVLGNQLYLTESQN